MQINSEKRSCDKSRDLDNFVSVYKNFPMENLKNFGCLKENCDSTIWDRLWIHEDQYDGLNSNESHFKMSFQSEIPTTIVKQTLAYYWPHFVADFGGYLGLLLGGSLLTFFDAISDFLHLLSTKIKRPDLKSTEE